MPLSQGLTDPWGTSTLCPQDEAHGENPPRALMPLPLPPCHLHKCSLGKASLLGCRYPGPTCILLLRDVPLIQAHLPASRGGRRTCLLPSSPVPPPACVGFPLARRPPFPRTPVLHASSLGVWKLPELAWLVREEGDAACPDPSVKRPDLPSLLPSAPAGVHECRVARLGHPHVPVPSNLEAVPQLPHCQVGAVVVCGPIMCATCPL